MEKQAAHRASGGLTSARESGGEMASKSEDLLILEEAEDDGTAVNTAGTLVFTAPEVWNENPGRDVIIGKATVTKRHMRALALLQEHHALIRLPLSRERAGGRAETRAYDLPPTEGLEYGGSQDPYVKITLGSTAERSNCVAGGGKLCDWASQLLRWRVDPCHDEHHLWGQGLVVEVWNDNQSRTDALIGRGFVRPETLRQVKRRSTPGGVSCRVKLSRKGKGRKATVGMLLNFEPDQARATGESKEGGTSEEKCALRQPQEQPSTVLIKDMMSKDLGDIISFGFAALDNVEFYLVARAGATERATPVAAVVSGKSAWGDTYLALPLPEESPPSLMRLELWMSSPVQDDQVGYVDADLTKLARLSGGQKDGLNVDDGSTSSAVQSHLELPLCLIDATGEKFKDVRPGVLSCTVELKRKTKDSERWVGASEESQSGQTANISPPGDDVITLPTIGPTEGPGIVKVKVIDITLHEAAEAPEIRLTLLPGKRSRELSGLKPQQDPYMVVERRAADSTIACQAKPFSSAVATIREGRNAWWLESCDLRLGQAEANFLRDQPGGGSISFTVTLTDRDVRGGDESISSLEVVVTPETLAKRESSVLWHRLFSQVGRKKARNVLGCARVPESDNPDLDTGVFHKFLKMDFAEVAPCEDRDLAETSPSLTVSVYTKLGENKVVSGRAEVLLASLCGYKNLNGEAVLRLAPPRHHEDTGHALRRASGNERRVGFDESNAYPCPVVAVDKTIPLLEDGNNSLGRSDGETGDLGKDGRGGELRLRALYVPDRLADALGVRSAIKTLSKAAEASMHLFTRCPRLALSRAPDAGVEEAVANSEAQVLDVETTALPGLLEVFLIQATDILQVEDLVDPVVRLKLLCSAGGESGISDMGQGNGTAVEWNHQFSLLIDDANVEIQGSSSGE
eukprot:g16627.t1